MVWEDDRKVVHVRFNDLLKIADRQVVSKSLALRVNHFQLDRTFSKALPA